MKLKWLSEKAKHRLSVWAYASLCFVLAALAVAFPGDDGVDRSFRYLAAGTLTVLGVSYVAFPRFRSYMQKRFIGASRYRRENLVDPYTVLGINLPRLQHECASLIREKGPKVSGTRFVDREWHPCVIDGLAFVLFPIWLETTVELEPSQGQDVQVYGCAVAYFRDSQWQPTPMFLTNEGDDLDPAMNELRRLSAEAQEFLQGNARLTSHAESEDS